MNYVESFDFCARTFYVQDIIGIESLGLNYVHAMLCETNPIKPPMEASVI